MTVASTDIPKSVTSNNTKTFHKMQRCKNSESRKSYYKTERNHFLDVKYKPISNKDRGTCTKNFKKSNFSSIDHFLDGVFEDFNFDEFILPVLKKDSKDFTQFINELENKS